MRILLLSLLALSGCFLEDSIPKPLVTLPFTPKWVNEGMTQEEVTSILGLPTSKTDSSFDREIWVYFPLKGQPTYCNTLERGPGFYLFSQESKDPMELTLLFDELKRLESFSYRPMSL